MTRTQANRPIDLIKNDVKGNTDNSVGGHGLIVGEVGAHSIAADNVVDRDGNAELSLATNIAAVGVLGLLLNL
jgi:hypothetical protein